MNFLNDILPLKNKLYRTALRITSNPQEAEDIVQNTLIKVWNRRDEWNEIQSIEAYSLTICRNLSLDYLKSRERQTIPLQDINSIPHSTEDPLLLLSQRESFYQIQNFINALPEKQRTCMHLRDIEGLTYKEIAQVLSITEEQVKINVFRARKAVKEKFLRTNDNP